MQLIVVLSVLLAATGVQGHASTESLKDHPIAKVITLLQDLAIKVKAEGQTEEVSFEKFVYWCKASTAELDDSIQEENDTIETLDSTIDSKTIEVSLLAEGITKLENEILDLQASDKSATDTGKSRNDLYLEMKKGHEDTISAIDEAIKALEEANTSTDTKLLLSQHRLAQNRVRNILALIATVASADEQSSLMNFVQDTSTATDLPTAHTKKYSFKSNSVTELLKTLKEKFEDELVEANKAETNAQNSYLLTKNARDAALKAAENSKTQKETAHSETQGVLSTAQGNLKDQKDQLKVDSGALQATQTSCSMKKSEWRERSSIREQELAAMAAAVQVLSKVSGVRTTAPSNPTLPAAVALMQVASLVQPSAGPQARAVQLLRATAKTYHSKALERMAAKVETFVPNQFQDVINQVQKMIFRLKQEQTDEDTHKAWCDVEISKSETSRDDKADKVAEQNAKIQEDQATVATLTLEVEAASKAMAEIRKFQSEATEIRNEGKRENKIAVQDADAALLAIANARAVLTKFYEEQGATKMESESLPSSPALWESSYTGVSDPNKAGSGVLAVLEVCSTDFSKMEADTRAQEVTDAKEYATTMKAHTIELARRGKETEMKEAQKKRLMNKITTLTSQKKHVGEELDATNQYLKDIEQACVTGDSTYEERKAARDAEIKALAEAQTILDKAFDTTTAAPTAAFLQKIGRHA